MSGAMESPIEVELCDGEENVQLRHKNDLLQRRFQYITNVTEKLKESHQLFTGIMDNAFIYSSKTSEPAQKDEQTEKEEISDANVQTEGFGHLEDECAVYATMVSEVFGRRDQQLRNELAAKEEDLRSATQKIARITERLEIELVAKQALQAEYDRLKADQQKSLLAELRNKQEIEELYRKAAELEAAIAKQNEIGPMIATVQKKQEPRTLGRFKPLLVVFLVSVIVAFFATLACISVDSTDPSDLYDRRQYI